MRRILTWGTYVPYWRLDRATIAAGAGGGKGTRAAAYDEDTTTFAVGYPGETSFVSILGNEIG